MSEPQPEKISHPKMRFSSIDDDNRRVQAYFVEDNGYDRLIIFRREQIDYIFEQENETSGIRLSCGVNISVRMNFRALDDILYNSDFRNDALIDLADVTKNASNATPKIGATMPDGTIYAGVSPETNKPLYAMPADASLTMSFNRAKEYAAKLEAHGHNDWRVPALSEMRVLFNNRAAIGGFDTDSNYRTSSTFSSKYGHFVHLKYFGNGNEGSDYTDTQSVSFSVRCVRGG